MSRFAFPAVPIAAEEKVLRGEVRAFLDEERQGGGFTPQADCWVSAADPAFSARLGARGWLGMTWPKAYGGADRPALHRLVVTEELLAAGAPVAAHWIADRQTGPQILRYGTEAQKRTYLPGMARGRSFAAIGMSEPQAGSDLAAVRTRAERTDGGWRLQGRKIWSTIAHLADTMIVLARTGPAQGRDRRAGLSQFLVPLDAARIEIAPIADIAGSHHFNEVLFDGVELPQDALLGTEGEGWAQCMGELAVERSGPERFLTTFALLQAALDAIGPDIAERGGAIVLGRAMARLRTLRRMSRGIAGLLQEGVSAETEAALVKDLGNALENEIVDDVRGLLAFLPRHAWPQTLASLHDDAVMRLPSHTLRGGTTEILRGIVARQLGMR